MQNINLVSIKIYDGNFHLQSTNGRQSVHFKMYHRRNLILKLLSYLNLWKTEYTLLDIAWICYRNHRWFLSDHFSFLFKDDLRCSVLLTCGDTGIYNNYRIKIESTQTIAWCKYFLRFKMRQEKSNQCTFITTVLYMYI